MRREIVTSDCLEAMRAMPEASVTAIVTDPPYGLEFMGKGWDKVLPPTEVWRECLRVLRPGGHALIFGGTRTYHRLACAVEDAGFEIRDCLMWLYGQGFPKSKSLDGEFEGYGTALKPAWEPILLARKPLIGTVAANALEHGTGALNIDGCRIGRDPADVSGWSQTGSKASENRSMSGANYARDAKPDSAGRWPANVVLDEEAAALLDAQAPDKGQAAPLKTRSSEDAAFAPHDAPGGASRFFYQAKSSKRDRNLCGDGASRDCGNNHATVKPVELMRWLVRLVTGPGENLILDPFAGSGTTGVACALEGVPFLLIEREAQYVEIIRRRIRAFIVNTESNSAPGETMETT